MNIPAHMEGQQLWTNLTKANEEIQRLRAVVQKIAEIPHLEVGCEHHPDYPCPICTARLSLQTKNSDNPEPPQYEPCPRTVSGEHWWLKGEPVRCIACAGLRTGLRLTEKVTE